MRFSIAILVSGLVVLSAGCHKHEDGDHHDHGSHSHGEEGKAPDAAPPAEHDHGSHPHGEEGKASDAAPPAEHDHSSHSQGEEPEAPDATPPVAEHDHGSHDHGSHDHGAHDHGEHGHHDVSVPSPYAGKTNPFAGNAAAARQGAELYAARCANCHGDRGAGDGRAAARLDPRPTDFTDAGHLDAMRDDYLLWRVAEGGEMAPFHSKMPAWKSRLSEEEIWKILAHVRTLAK